MPNTGSAKSLALLAHLALDGHGGFYRRDSLVALLWPELDQTHARAALRKALYHLRGLNSELLDTRGDDEVRLSPAALWCDANELIHQARESPAEALALYRGELLPGFHVHDSPEFERWLDESRHRLRTVATDCATRLAETARAGGARREAVQWARRAAEISPLEEGPNLLLIETLEEAGDRSAALAAFDRFRARLKTELDVEPGEATRKLAASLRARAGELEEQIPRESVGPTVIAATVPPSRVKRSLVILGMLSLVIAAIGLFWYRGQGHVPVMERFAVIPFENRTGNPAYDDLGVIAADWITQGLVEAGLAEVVPTSVVAAAIDTANAHPAEPVVTRVGRETEATKLVTGSYFSAGDSVRFHAEVILPGARKSLASVTPVTVLPRQSILAIDTVRHRVLGAIAVVVNPIWGPYAERMSTLPPSLEVYRLIRRAGEAAFRGSFDESEALVRQLLALDSTFVPAILLQANIFMVREQFLEADSVLKVVENRGSGPVKGDLSALALFRAWLNADRDAAYRSFLRDSAVLGNGWERMQFGQEAASLNRPREALRTYARVNMRSLEMADKSGAWVMIAGAHHMLGELDAALRVIRDGRKVHPRILKLAKVEAMTLAAMGRHADLKRVEEEARNLPPDGNSNGFGELLRFVSNEYAAHGDPVRALETANRAVEWYASRSPAERERLRLEEVQALWIAGRASEAEARLPVSCPSTILDHIVCLEWIGVVSAAAGNTGRADSAETAIATLDLSHPWPRASAAHAYTALAAARGQLDLALDRLRDNFAKGRMYNSDLHQDPQLAPLRNHPGFKELIRPKG